ncbi:MAG TPA: hypothetical protein VF049_01635 [Nocardioidaceae bacterium]
MRATLRRAIAALAAGCVLLPGTALAAAHADPTEPTSPASPTTGAQPGATRGTWHVDPVAPDTYTVTWRSPQPLPVTDAAPEVRLADETLGVPALSPDGRTLTLTVTSPAAPDTADLDVVLSGRVLDAATQPVPAEPAPSAAAEYAAPQPGRRLTIDPGRRGTHRVVSGDYRLPRMKLEGLPRRVEMIGHVERPADPDPADPLVLFLHGRHEYCYRTPGAGSGPRDWPCRPGSSPVPSYLGYRYVQRLLAGQGYVTVSISANGVNAQDFRLADGGARARAQLVRAHLERWSRWATAGRYAVDLRRVVLVGHSRGGEGVDQAALATPLSAPYRVVGQVLVAPTDFSRQVAAYVPTVVLLPYCDGDVVDLQGQGYTDMARDLVGDDTALRSSVLVMGANHNFFNTEWTPGLSAAPSWDDGAMGNRTCRPDGPVRLTAAEQRAVARTYLASAVRLTAADQQALLPMFDGSRVRVPSAGDADVRTHLLGAGRPVRRPGVDAALVPGTATARICSGRSGGEVAARCGRGADPVQAPHWPAGGPLRIPSHPAMEMTWTSPGAAGLALDDPLDLTGADRLDLRTVVDPVQGAVRLGVRLYDGQGRSALVTPRGDGLLHPLPGRVPLGKLWAQTLRVPLAGLSGVDLGDLRRVDLVGRSDHGRVWLLDLAGAYRTLPPVPARRLPRVVLGDARVTEGDESTRQTVQVPFEVFGTVREPARIVVTGFEVGTGKTVPPTTVHLVPGQRSGSVPVGYLPDRRDDLPVQRIWLTSYAVHAAMPSRSVAQLRLLDDDPPPRVRVRVRSASVREGGAARWLVTLSKPVDYYPTVRGVVVGNDSALPPLRADDVPRRWLRGHTYPVPAPRTTLAGAGVGVAATLRPGRRTAVLSIPVVRDGRREGREAVTLRIWVRGLSEPVRRTVRVDDAARARVLP